MRHYIIASAPLNVITNIVVVYTLMVLGHPPFPNPSLPALVPLVLAQPQANTVLRR